MTLLKLRTTQKKASKTKLPGLVASYNTRPGNEVGLFYNAVKPRGLANDVIITLFKYCATQSCILSAGKLWDTANILET